MRNLKNYLFILSTVFVIFLVSFLIIIKIDKKQTSSVSVSPSQKIVRKAAVAGSFYPADPKELETKVTSLISYGEPIEVKGKLRILIVPHAGIDFSGGVAGWGFKQIEGKDYQQIILLGASHKAFFDHAAVYSSGSWETPLGKVEIDEDLAKAILDKDKKIISDSKVHKEEHSLEIELIFLQKALSNFKIIPILVSQPQDELIDSLAQQISSVFDEKTLLIISSDLSHYPSWEIANLVDSQTIEAILTGKKENLEKTVLNIESKHYPNLETAACGYQPLRLALKIAEILNLKDSKKIRYENSADTSGDKSRVVGYGALGFWSEKINSTVSQLDNYAKEEALKIAKDTLVEYLNNKKTPLVKPENEVLSQPLGAFVTLKKKGELRGCIGEFEPKEPLYQVIQEMTIASATKDTRFPPVEPSELSSIKIEISVLSPKKRIGNWQEIKIGKQGVVIQKDSRSGTFLPQVATETGWSLEEFLTQLCSQKAGLSSNCYKDLDTQIYVFEAQVFAEESL